MRCDAALSILTDAQQADLFKWLSEGSYSSVQERLAKPPPEGFGLRVHATSLARFLREYSARLRAEDFLLAQQDASAAQPDSSEAFLAAATFSAAHATFLHAGSSLNLATYRAVVRSLQQHKNAALKNGFLEVAREHVAIARARLELDRQEFQYNAARAALSVLPDLNAIDRLAGIDDEDKIWRARQRLFGSCPPPTSPGPGPASPPGQEAVPEAQPPPPGPQGEGLAQ